MMAEPRSRDAPLPLFIVAGIFVLGGVAAVVYGWSGRTIEGGRADGLPVSVFGIGAVAIGVVLAVMVFRGSRKSE
jgi:Zn-dependent protease with chaperone function